MKLEVTEKGREEESEGECEGECERSVQVSRRRETGGSKKSVMPRELRSHRYTGGISSEGRHTHCPGEDGESAVGF